MLTHRERKMCGRVVISGLLFVVVGLGRAGELPAHPRILFTRDRLPLLRKLSKDDDVDAVGLSGALLWGRVLKFAELATQKRSTVPPAFSERAGRMTADRWAPLALAYAITGEFKYLEQLRTDLNTVKGWKVWGGNPLSSFSILHITFGVALALDVLWDDLTPEERKEFFNVLATKGLKPIYNTAKGGRYAYPHNNGALFLYSALGLGAMAVLGEKDYPEAEVWVKEAEASVRAILEKSGPGGGWAEGLGYGTIAFDGMLGLTFIDALKRLRGIDLFQLPLMKNLPLFALHTMLPGGKGGVGFNDTWQRSGFHLVMLRATREYGAPQYAWYLKQTGYKGGKGGIGAVNAFLQYRKLLEVASPDGTVPLSHLFETIGWATCRTSWEDPDAVLLAIQSEHFGHSHEHNSMNHFEIYAYGSRLATSPGYHHRRYWRATYGHNLIWVDGQGQRFAYVGPLDGGIKRFLGSPFFDFVACQTSVYGKKLPKERMIEYWWRYVVFAKPDYIVVFDDIKSANNVPREYKWILNVTCAHSIAQKGEFKVRGDTVLALPRLAPTGQLFGKVILPDDFLAESLMWDEKAFNETYGPYYALTPKEKKVRERFLVVLYPQPRNAPPPQITGFSAEGGRGIEVRVPEGTNFHLYRLDREKVCGKNVETDGVTSMLGFSTDGELISYALCDGKELKRDGITLISSTAKLNCAFSKWVSYRRRSDRFPVKNIQTDVLYGSVELSEGATVSFFTERPQRVVLVDDHERTDAKFEQNTGLVALPLKKGRHSIVLRLSPRK